MQRVSRRPDQLPADVRSELEQAGRAATTAESDLKAAVLKAKGSGSVREIAKATGISPTTVQKWLSAD